MLPLKHIQKRKTHKTSKNVLHSQLDNLIYIIAFLGPVMTLPQVYDVWIKKSVSVNEITWGSYIVFAAIWLVYGITHKEKPIIISNFLWIFVQSLVVIGVILHR